MPIKKLIENRFNLDDFTKFLKDNFDDVEILDTRLKDIVDESDRVDVAKYRYFADGFLVDDNEIGVLLLESTSPNIENKRVGFANVINKLSKPKIQDILLIVIYHPNSDVWRLTFVSYNKRYSFVLGKDIAINTAYTQLSTINKKSNIEDIKEAFSVEKVTKEFFNDYKSLYFEICDYLSVQIALFKDEDNIKFFGKKLLGRIVFLYFLQKKGWLGTQKEWGDGDKKFLSNSFANYKKNNFYTQLLQEIFFNALNKNRKDDYFKILNCKMPFLNGGLFAKDEFDRLDIIIENDIFKKIFEVFDRYNFTIIEDNSNDSEVAIDPEMLGRVFEDLLEDRKDKGAFYTPREIVHYMCQQSIKDYLQTKPQEIRKLDYIKNIKILDPAIGSGAFPMGILHEVIKIREELGDKTPLSKLKKEVIENSIYGIDIEESAVEIAKLRFWLSIVVDEDTPTPLPNLAYKIMVGNSLLETINGYDPFEKQSNQGLFDDNNKIERVQQLIHKYFNETNNNKKIKLDKDINKIIDSEFESKIKEYEEQIKLKSSRLYIGTKREQDTLTKSIEEDYLNLTLFKKIAKEKPTTELFFYKLYFAEVMNEGGFDIVIGNPPYLRVQGIDKETSTRYKKAFDSATGSYDLYVLFTEKALELLSPNGIANFIVPHKWINSSFGKGLREISRDKISKFISFGAYQVFNASTYTSLIWFKKSPNKTLDYAESNKDLNTNKELEAYLFNLKDDDYTKIKNSELSSDSWVFTDKQTYNILEKLKRQPFKMSNIFKIFTGLQTSKDSVYFLKNCRSVDSLIIGYSTELEKEISIEDSLVKVSVKGNQVHRYEKIKKDNYIIFPYYFKDEKATLYTESEIKEKFPNGYTYLKECEDILRGRERGKLKNDNFWFRYIYPKSLTLFDKEKLITPQLSLGGQVSYDENSKFYFKDGNHGLIKYSEYKESYKFYLAILNSKLMWFFIKNTSSVFSGGYYYYKPMYLNHFPLPKIDNIEDTKPFEILVDYIMLLKTLDTPINEYVPNSHIIYKFEKVLDAMVYELYFKEEFESKNIEFISYAKEDYQAIEKIEDESKQIEIVLNAYDTLSQTKNKIRNNLILMWIDLSDLITPIGRSL